MQHVNNIILYEKFIKLGSWSQEIFKSKQNCLVIEEPNMISIAPLMKNALFGWVSLHLDNCLVLLIKFLFIKTFMFFNAMRIIQETNLW